MISTTSTQTAKNGRFFAEPELLIVLPAASRVLCVSESQVLCASAFRIVPVNNRTLTLDCLSLSMKK